MSSDPSKRRTPGRGLGRGLGALIVNTQPDASEQAGETRHDAPPPHGSSAAHPPSSSAEPEARATIGLRSLAIDRITPNPHQPRTHFDPAALHELAASIREHGIIQPLIVTAAPDQPNHFWLIAGERRWRAAQLAELDQVPVTIREVTPQQRLEWALVENIQRADLNALEEAAAYHTLVEEFGLTQSEVGRRVGKSRSAVANTLRLLQLPQPVQDALLQAAISPGHARALLALDQEEAILDALDRILEHSMSVRQTEEMVRHLLTQPSPDGSDEVNADDTNTDEIDADKEEPAQRAHLTYLENRFRDILGTRVNLNRNRNGSGRLVVHFYNDEDLANIFELIAGSEDEV